MGDSKEFIPQSVAELADGTTITPENEAEENWLTQIANNPTMSDEQKDRVAKMGVLFTPNNFDIEFDAKKRKSYPTDLDPQLRQMIRES